LFKVAHIISGDLWAGAEVMVFNLMTDLSKIRNLKIYAILLNEGRLSEELDRAGISIYILNEKNLSFISILHRLNCILKIIKPDILHSHRYKENLLAFLSKFLSDADHLVATQHGMPEYFRGKRSIHHTVVTRLNFFLMKHTFDRIICVSNDIKNRFTNLIGIKDEILTVIHNGINIPAEDKVLNHDRIFRIGTAGRLFPVKDYPLFIKIAQIILVNNPNVQFLLAGDGPDRNCLQELVDKDQISKNFKFLGHVESMDSFYGRLDLYLNTSIHEGISMSVLEAMAHGVPIIAPKTGGLCEILEDAKSGCLINSREPEEFADVCINLIKNRKLYRNLSLGARNRAKTAFSAEHMADSYYRLYKELLSAP
jgi:glycosyltransferase involved in cell wall biosynthesis